MTISWAYQFTEILNCLLNITFKRYEENIVGFSKLLLDSIKN